MKLKVTALRAEAEHVVSVELRDPNGGELPAFAPGAHLELTLPADEPGTPPHIRHYSLCNSSLEKSRYVIAVGLSSSSRGGSRFFHEHVRLGSILNSQLPKNNFPLDHYANHYRFIAGGIGITPILSMIKWCLENKKSWSLLYCARSQASAAYFEELRTLGPNVSFHMDDSAAGSFADLKAALANPLGGEHVYCCGPRSLMLGVEEASAHWPENSVHFEWFSAKEIAPPPQSENASGEFDVVIKSSGARLRVSSDKSILETLEDHGLAISYSCRQGVCGACETGLCDGIADHRDQLLTPEQKASQKTILLCVSRAKSSSLVLDL